MTGTFTIHNPKQNTNCSKLKTFEHLCGDTSRKLHAVTLSCMKSLKNIVHSCLYQGRDISTQLSFNLEEEEEERQMQIRWLLPGS